MYFYPPSLSSHTSHQMKESGTSHQMIKSGRHLRTKGDTCNQHSVWESEKNFAHPKALVRSGFSLLFSFLHIPRRCSIERSMTSRYHGCKISGPQQSFLTETAICIVDPWKKSNGLCSECYHPQGRQTCQVFRFFLPYLQDHSLLRS